MRSTTKGDRLYLHVFDWPAGGKLELPRLKGSGKVVAASLLAGNKKVAVEQGADGKVVLALPQAAPDPLSSTVVVTVRGALALGK